MNKVHVKEIVSSSTDIMATSLIEKAYETDESLLERNLWHAIRAYERVKGYEAVKYFVERYPYKKK